MSTPPVYWHQGMFLRPHHFQAGERYLADQVRRSGQFDVHYNWGSRVVKVDPAGLKNFRFVVERLAARMRDGTLVLVEQGTDHSLDPLELKPAMDKLGPGQTVDVLLAVPLLQIGRANAGRPDDPSTRYHVDPARTPIEDENDGRTPCLVDTRRLNVKLFTTLQETSGYDVLPIARLERSVKATGEPQLHEPYIPPVLACDGWDELRDGVIGQVYNRVGGLVKQLSKTVKDQNIRFDSNNPDHRKIFERLRALNEGWAAFGVIANAEGVHPLFGYLELCRLVGKLSVFGKSAMLPDLPAYDHDDLGKCFFTVKRHLDDLLGEVKQGYEVRPFVGEGLKMRVKIEPTWLAPACQLLVGVDSTLPAAECARLLTARLNMKIGALERVDEVFRTGLRGLEFVHDDRPPSVLPAGPTYFRISRDSSQPEWEAVKQSFNLAVRLNDKLILGSMDGKSDVTIQADGKTGNFGFTLYVVLPAAQS
jgi:type VI secretion system protein ImpJ